MIPKGLGLHGGIVNGTGIQSGPTCYLTLEETPEWTLLPCLHLSDAGITCVSSL